MAKGFAIHNSMTSHGGIIKATQQRTSQMGNLFLRAGDGHYCPQCQCWSKIVKSHDHIIMDGKAVAYVDDLLTCGAKILPKQDHVVGTSQGENYRSSSSSIAPVQNNFISSSKNSYGQRFLLQDELTGEPLSNVCYEIEKNGEIIHGKTDGNGYTELVTSSRPEEIQVHIIYEEHDHE